MIRQRGGIVTRTLLLAAAVFASSCLCDAQSVPADVVLENQNNLKVYLTPIGATIHKLLVPQCRDKSKTVDVALGYDDVSAYGRDPHPSFGATVGRVANRISNARFSLNGVTYNLTANEGPNSIHGGAVKWSQQMWRVVDQSKNNRSVTFQYISKDGEAGYPGTVTTNVTYSIPESGSSLDISITATTTKPTPLNIINHNYFNLKGAGKGDVLDHIVKIPAEYFTPAKSGELLPTGEIHSVKGTVYDFTTPVAIRKRYQLANGGPFKGYDLNYVMPVPSNDPQPVWWTPGQNPQTAADATTRNLTFGAEVLEPTTGLKLSVYTNAPGIHFYSGNFLAASGKEYAASGKGGVLYPQYGGFCFETQAFPNAVNTPTFPSSIVKPGEVFNNRVEYAFSCA